MKVYIVLSKKTKHKFKEETRKIFKKKKDKNFVIFKISNIITFQLPSQDKLFLKHNDIFADGTLLLVPKFSYQNFITRTYIKKLNYFYTTSFSILKNKENITYEILLKEIKKTNSRISNVVKIVFPNTNFKYCAIHYKRITDEINALIKYYKKLEILLEKKRKDMIK
ncbi:hypothetical protein H8356DRAFT_1429426 [Neocallimastix lanati (nom. inval.)]|nr:hypothetical protein H8356DRAFT_1429426 [Neocallimastix sp. JGI-2020a]